MDEVSALVWMRPSASASSPTVRRGHELRQASIASAKGVVQALQELLLSHIVEVEHDRARTDHTTAKAAAAQHRGHRIPPPPGAARSQTALGGRATKVDRREGPHASKGMVPVRIVWRGGLLSERAVRLPISTRRHAEIEAQIVARIDQPRCCAGLHCPLLTEIMCWKCVPTAVLWKRARCLRVRISSC
jgi:hypothetical protein